MSDSLTEQAEIGIIGGSGFYNIEGLGEVQELDLDTPFGKPSDKLTVGTLEGQRVAFIARHGRGHRFSPSEIPVQANIYALKMLGVRHVISVSAVGSMKEEIAPSHIVATDQIYDRTVSRPRTFFGRGIVVHVTFDQPFCEPLRQILLAAGREQGATIHDGGTYVCIEGPQFSTLAESQTYRSWGVSVVGMTAIPEAKLAREAEMCYATMAMVTDYDCWHPSHESVTVAMVIQTLQQNTALAKRVVREAVRRIGAAGVQDHACFHALENSIITNPAAMPADEVERVRLLIGKYVK